MFRVVEQETVGPQHVAVGQREIVADVVAFVGEALGEVRLQIAGIMSEEPLVDVNRELENAKEKAFALGVSRGVDPFMTLSFMALPVIPTLRLTTRGVFDTVTQKYV